MCYCIGRPLHPAKWQTKGQHALVSKRSAVAARAGAHLVTEMIQIDNADWEKITREIVLTPEMS